MKWSPLTGIFTKSARYQSVHHYYIIGRDSEHTLWSDPNNSKWEVMYANTVSELAALKRINNNLGWTKYIMLHQFAGKTQEVT